MMQEKAMDIILELIADDPQLVTYRPKLRKITKSVTATILLQQMLHRWKGQDRQPFYKFKEPCDHKAYRKGDSWTEELGFSSKEFDNAIKKIGYKKGKSKAFQKIPKKDAYIIFYTDKDRMTWYEIQEENILKAINRIYLVTDQREDSYTTKGKLDSNQPKVSYPLTETTTKNTTETTSAKAESSSQDKKKQNKTETDPDLGKDNSNIPAKTKTNSNLGLTSSYTSSDAEPNSNTEQDKKQFSLPEKNINDMTKEEWDALCQACEPPPKINRKVLRKKHNVRFAPEYYQKFLEAKANGFNGNAQEFKDYAAMEYAVWDKSKGEPSADLFLKEMFCRHPIAQHYLSLTPEQRELELA